MGLKLNGSTSGSVALNAPASTTSGADVVLTLPVNDGDSGNFLRTDGSGTLTWATPTDTTTNLTRGTVAATTSGTEVDFTSLPTGIRKITLVLDQVSVDNNSNINARLSTGSTFATTGYTSQGMRVQDGSTSTAVSLATSFAVINSDSGARVCNGSFTWHNITGNVWVMSGTAAASDDTRAFVSNGRIDLGGTLDGIRLWSAGTFDSGQINIFYEV